MPGTDHCGCPLYPQPVPTWEKIFRTHQIHYAARIFSIPAHTGQPLSPCQKRAGTVTKNGTTDKNTLNSAENRFLIVPTLQRGNAVVTLQRHHADHQREARSWPARPIVLQKNPRCRHHRPSPARAAWPIDRVTASPTRPLGNASNTSHSAGPNQALERPGLRSHAGAWERSKIVSLPTVGGTAQEEHPRTTTIAGMARSHSEHASPQERAVTWQRSNE